MAKIAKKVVGSNGVEFQFANGEKIDANLDGLNQDMLTRLAIHGLSQKIGDSYASAGEKGWSVEDCRDAALDVYNNLLDGVWSAAGGSGVNILAEAVARLLDKTVEDAVAVIGAMDEEAKKALAKRADVKAEVAKIKAERATARAAGAKDGADFDDLLDMFR